MKSENRGETAELNPAHVEFFIMKMLGSTRGQILGAQALEYGILAVVLGMVSLLLGMSAAYYVVVQIFDFSFMPNYSILALTLIGGTGLTFSRMAAAIAARDRTSL